MRGPRSGVMRNSEKQISNIEQGISIPRLQSQQEDSQWSLDSEPLDIRHSLFDIRYFQAIAKPSRASFLIRRHLVRGLPLKTRRILEARHGMEDDTLGTDTALPSPSFPPAGRSSKSCRLAVRASRNRMLASELHRSIVDNQLGIGRQIDDQFGLLGAAAFLLDLLGRS